MTITNRERPVAVLSPAPAVGTQPSIVGAMRGSVLAYDSPLSPTAAPSDWIGHHALGNRRAGREAALASWV